jgi:hypothetical protein
MDLDARTIYWMVSASHEGWADHFSAVGTVIELCVNCAAAVQASDLDVASSSSQSISVIRANNAMPTVGVSRNRSKQQITWSESTMWPQSNQVIDADVWSGCYSSKLVPQRAHPRDAGFASNINYIASGLSIVGTSRIALSNGPLAARFSGVLGHSRKRSPR